MGNNGSIEKRSSQSAAIGLSKSPCSHNVHEVLRPAVGIISSYYVGVIPDDGGGITNPQGSYKGAISPDSGELSPLLQ